MQLSFWGVRGSLPAPERRAWRYGGNTPCLEVRAGKQLFILDAGTGIRELGHRLTSGLAPPGREIHLLLTHYHWDHIQGLPFFAPLYRSGDTVHIFGPRPQSETISGVICELFRAPFFPISASDLKGAYTVRELDWTSDFTVGDVRIRTCRANHPQGALAYRLDSGDASIVYVTDHEPGDPEADQAVCRLARGVDVLISDAQYGPEELGREKAGWGHGSWLASVALARAAGATNLILFHHEPVRTDSELDRVLHHARAVFPNTWVAAEAMDVEVNRGALQVGNHGARLGQRASVHLPVRVETRHQGVRLRHEIHLEGISVYGAYFLSPHPYELEQAVDVVLSLRARGNGHSNGRRRGRVPRGKAEFHLRGYVVHTRQLETNGWTGVAVHFPAPGCECAEPLETPAARKTGQDLERMRMGPMVTKH